MMRAMAPPPTGHGATTLRELRRDPGNGILGGVCEGIGRHVGIDPLLVRVVFAATTLASGLGLVAYLLAWMLMPAVSGADRPVAAADRPAPRGRRAAIEIGLGAGLLVVSVLLAFRALGLPFSDALAWPSVLVAAGGALIWRQSAARVEVAQPSEPAGGRVQAAIASDEPDSRPAVVSRIGVGVTLVLAAAIVFLQLTGALAAATDVALAALVVAIALGVIFAPFFVRLATSLSLERAERIRSQERAEVAAHLHDSVLQTLALVQKRADDPREVAALARRQERELRSWLTGAAPRGGDGLRLAAALQTAADDVERAHGVAIDVVAVGDAPLDRDGEALVAAAREAMLNAAKFAGGGATIAVYAEATAEQLKVFVRDRGPGFEPGRVPPDRRGVRESIVGRMERHGGRAAIRSSAGGDGTEVELTLPRRTPA